MAIGNNFLAIPFLKVTQDKDSGLPKEEEMELLGKRLRERESLGRYRSHVIFPIGFKADELKSEFDPGQAL